MVWYKRELPIGIMIFCGVFMLVDYYFALPPYLVEGAKEIRNISSLLAAYALGMGAATIYKSNILKITKKGEGWMYSIIILATLSVTIIFGLIQGVAGSTFLWLFDNLYIHIGSMFGALRAFFIVTASYRAFRAKTVETTLMLFAAVLVLFMNAPIAEYAFPPFTNIGSWILDVPNVAGFRGMIIGTALGIVGLGVRILIGNEKTIFYEGGAGEE